MRRWSTMLAASLVLTTTVPGSAADGEDLPEDTAAEENASRSGTETPDVIGGPTSVGNQLVEDDSIKSPWFPLSLLHEGFYDFRRRVRETTGIELNIDYNYLNQVASFSSRDRRGASGALRFYGRWRSPGKNAPANGSLIFRIENRHTIGPQTPKELGFATGSSLSTAGFKDFGWGITALYWLQHSEDERFAIAVGQMDPGDFEDIHPLLNPWTAFTNDASFNNPSTALPNQGLGVVVRAFVSDHIYLKGGVSDANGTPTKIDLKSFFDVREYFTWVEAGWSAGPTQEAMGDSVHLTVWRSDERVEAGVPDGWGLAFSAAHEFGGRWTPFVRAGYSEGNAANLSAMVSLGAGWRIRSDDVFGAAVTWARPPQEKEGRDQYTAESYYRFQLTDNIQLTPGFFCHYQPSYNPTNDLVWVGSIIRFRISL